MGTFLNLHGDITVDPANSQRALDAFPEVEPDELDMLRGSEDVISFAVTGFMSYTGASRIEEEIENWANEYAIVGSIYGVDEDSGDDYTIYVSKNEVVRKLAELQDAINEAGANVARAEIMADDLPGKPEMMALEALISARTGLQYCKAWCDEQLAKAKEAQ